MDGKGPMEATLLQVVLYLRVSTEDQARRGYSLAEQREACLAKAEALAAAQKVRTGHPVQLQTAEFVDTVSGELLERPELDRVRLFVRERRPAWFICLDPDRFSRTTYHAILIANEIEAAGTRLEFVQHDYQQTPEGRLFFTLRVAIAEYEKAKILERTARGKRGKLAKGGLPSGLHMYGYRYDRLTQAVEPDPAEARWVAQIFRWASQGLGCQEIASRLNEANVPCKRGGRRWYRGTVSKLLRNRGYTGELQVNRYDARGIGVQRQLPQERRTRRLTPVQRPPAQWVTIQIPPLIPRELWEQVSACRGAEPRRLAQRRAGLLSGLLACGYCGGPVHYRPHPSLGQVLRCANRYPYLRDLRAPQPVCRALPHQGAGPIEAQVWAQVTAWLTGAEALRLRMQERQATGRRPASAVQADELALLEEQLEAQQQAQSRLLAVVAAGAVEPETAAAHLAPYQARIAALRERIAALRLRVAEATHHADQREETDDGGDPIRTEAEAVHSRLACLSLPHRQALIRMLIRRVTVYRNQTCAIEAQPGVGVESSS